MIRRIIKINKDLCNGCGLCAKACHEGAIGMVNGKAQLLREDYCDGLGDCLPACPTGAITFEEREAPAYNEAAVLTAKQKKPAPHTACQVANRQHGGMLRNFPIQLKLVPENAEFLDGADLLIAADCTAFAYTDFHKDFIAGRIVLIGCPKLDGSYTQKLTEIFRNNDIRSITVTRMQVPCCGGLPFTVKTALEACGKDIPCLTVVFSADGRIISQIK